MSVSPQASRALYVVTEPLMHRVPAERRSVEDRFALPPQADDDAEESLPMAA